MATIVKKRARACKDKRPAVVIPEEAVIPEQARQFVYLLDGGVVRKREVLLGRREPGFVEVTSGLKSGDHVVTEGTIKLRDGVAVRDVGATGSPAAAPTPGS